MSKDKKKKTGYCNPPKEHQFKPGQSGNPKGRPKKAPDKVCDIVEQVFFGDRKVRINGKEVTSNYMALMLTNLAQSAATGNISAARLMHQISDKYGFTEKIEIIPPFVPSRQELAKRWGKKDDKKKDDKKK